MATLFQMLGAALVGFSACLLIVYSLIMICFRTEESTRRFVGSLTRGKSCHVDCECLACEWESDFDDD